LGAMPVLVFIGAPANRSACCRSSAGPGPSAGRGHRSR
jgi:hypothetical protein